MGSGEPLAVSPQTRRMLRDIARRSSGLELLVLFGSRARGEAHSGSDWDFAFRGPDSVDVGILIADLGVSLSTNHVDLVDLDRAGGLLRYQVARDGVPIYEARPHAFEQFWLDAVSFWCDARHVLEPAYNSIVERISE